MSWAHAQPISDLTLSLLERCRFPPEGSTVECAVSGGPDSMALLALATAAGLDVTAVHVDHGLREGSDLEYAHVERAAARFGARFEARSVLVEAGPNLEARARDARYSVLAPDVLTGHTLDDQAETVLLFLMRGTGPEGLTGIDPANRPLLALRRTETEALCADLGIALVRDPSNEDLRTRRNRVRLVLLPFLSDMADRDVAPLIARTADLQRDVVAALDACVAGVDPTDALALASLPPALATHAVRRWWREVTGVAYAPDAAATARMMAVARGSAAANDVVGGWRIERTAQRLRLVPPPGTTGMVSGQ